ncbi:MAG TPA: alpha/beta hydrolase-fold protein [Prolixibacteraceae bacterium]|nr:alpha/beta hydrolase-fold protein [Prolixibacteraceae bacterium]
MGKITILLILMGLMSMQVSGKWFQQKSIYSKALQQEKTYYVGLPDGYNASDTVTKYPVIVFLHGASVNATDMVNSLEPYLDNFLGRILFAKLFKVIFVIPDGSCGPYKGSFYTNSALYGNYEDYIANDLMQEVAANYKIYKGRAKWSIMGHSMGGYGAMKIALKYPQKFIGVSALSGPLNVTYFNEMLPVLQSEHGAAAPYDFTYEGNFTKLVYSMAGAFSPNPGAAVPVLFPVNTEGNMDHTILQKWEDHNPIQLIRQWKGNPSMAIHTYCGDKDEFKLATPNKMFSDTLDKYQLPHTYTQDPNGEHVSSLFTSLPQGTNFLYNVMDTARIRVSTGIERITASNNLTLYPKPVKDQFYIAGTVADFQHLVIYNLSGQKVMQIDNQTAGESVNVSALEKGMYIISLHSKNGYTSTCRLIKQ